MSDSLFATTRHAYRERGWKEVAVLVMKKCVSPFARVGSLYFFERNLQESMPPIKPVHGILVREGTIEDVHLLERTDPEEKHRRQAIDRLLRGDLWFIAIEASSGKLANYRWASQSSGFIPELDLHLVVEPRQAYIYDLETLPEFRRRGIEAVTRQFTYESLLHKYGVERIITYIRADNHASLQAGRQYLTPIGRVWFARRNSRAHVFRMRRDRMPELTREMRSRPVQAALARSSNSLR